MASSKNSSAGQTAICYKHPSKDGVIRGRRIGSGGFGVVFKVKLSGGTQVYAMKEIPVSSTKQQDIKREISIMAQVNHCNVLRSTITYITATKVYIVMDWMKTDLFVVWALNGGKIVYKYFLMGIAQQTAAALAYLHRAGVIHRDFKPENVMISNNYMVKLSDFGLSSTSNIAYSRVGTADYTPPEILKLSNNGYNHKCDTYSWGVSMSLLTGQQINSVDAARLDESFGIKGFGQLLEAAVHSDPTRRPAMRAISRMIDTTLKNYDTNKMQRRYQSFMDKQIQILSTQK